MSDQRRRRNPPPVKCSATAKHTGKACQHWAMPGLPTCKRHGALGGRAGKAAAEERAAGTITLAEMMANHPGRPVWEVILDSIRTVDVLAQAAAQDVALGKVTTAEGIERVAGLARSAHAMAASAVATKALDMATQSADRWGDVMADRLVVFVSDWLGLPLAGHAVTAAIQATLSGIELGPAADRTRVAAPDGPPLMDEVGHAVAAALASRFGLPAGPVAAWFLRLVEAVADGRAVPDLPGGPVAALPPVPAPEPEPAPPVTAEPPRQDSKVAGWSGQEPEPEVSDPEPETVDAELVEEPEPRPRLRRVTTTLGYRPGEVTMPTTYREFR